MSTLRNSVFSALSTADKFGKDIDAIRADSAVQAVITDRDALRYLLLPHVAAKRGCAVVPGERKAKGKMVLDSASPNYNTTKSDLDRLVKAVMGATSGKGETETLTVPRHIAELAKALAEACNEYEQARKLASTAVAAAFAK